MADVTYRMMQNACGLRNEAWTGGQFDLRDHIVEMVEEFGEFASNVKRLRRFQVGAATDGRTMADLNYALANELGDMGVVLCNIANELHLDLGECVVEKFNMTSDKYGFTDHKVRP